MSWKISVCLVLAIVFAILGAYVWATNPFNLAGDISFRVQVIYADGTSETYKSPAFSLQPFTITDTSGKEIKSLNIALLAKLQTSGTVTQWSITGTQHVEVYKRPETTPKTSSTININAQGTSWANGEEKQISLVTITSSQIEGAVAQYGTGNWFWQTTASLSVQVTFSTGAIDTATAVAPAAGFDFVYTTAGIQSFTVTIQNQALLSLLPTAYLTSYLGLPTWTLHALFPILTVVFAALTVHYHLKEV